jgi:hypothetical protein
MTSLKCHKLIRLFQTIVLINRLINFVSLLTTNYYSNKIFRKWLKPD